MFDSFNSSSFVIPAPQCVNEEYLIARSSTTITVRLLGFCTFSLQCKIERKLSKMWSLHSPSGGASLATLVVPHSAMSAGAAWNCVTTSVWWLCRNPEVELRYTMQNVVCSNCLVVCFPTAYWSILLRKAARTQGGPHTSPCTMKALHTKCGLWQPQESCHLGGCGGVSRIQRSEP